MLVAANLRNQQALGTSAAAPALLLVHMRALQLHVLRELKSELAGEAQETNVCKGKKMARLKLRGGAEAFVATVDALSSELVANEKAQSEDEVAASLRKVWAGVLTTVRSRAIWPVGHRQSRLVGAVGTGTGTGRGRSRGRGEAFQVQAAAEAAAEAARREAIALAEHLQSRLKALVPATSL